MVKPSERLFLLMRMVTDKRLRNDVKALRYAAEGYKSYAWELLKEAGVAGLLRRGSRLKDVTKKAGISNSRFLEGILDFLVGCGALEHSRGRYRLLKEPGAFTGKEYRFLEELYPNSVEWTHSLRRKARGVLVSGKANKEAGFDDDRFLRLWEGIMQESPWSFRRMAIRKFSGKVREGAEILDLGCGSGVSLEQILMECKRPVRITGMDQSRKSLERARERMEGLFRTSQKDIVRENIRRMSFKRHDLSKGIPKGKSYDVVFMSLLVNHIPEKDRASFFRGVRDVLKDNGLLVIYQIVHDSRFRRAPMWVMHVVPTHEEYPFREEYVEMLRGIFSSARDYLDGVIVVARR